MRALAWALVPVAVWATSNAYEAGEGMAYYVVAWLVIVASLLGAEALR